jgi:D-serine deaminase-like pyridoxal phosphate-dependent protein
LLANLLVDPAAIRWIASHVLGGEDTGFSCYVESVASVELLDRECGKAGPAGRLDVLLEVGYLGGRTGVRRLEESLGVARAVNQSEHLRLIGVAGYEGRMPGAATGEPAGLDVYLESIAQTARQLNAGGLFEAGRVPVVTAGGSSYFDRVVARLGPDRFDFPVQTVLRSGCYLTHDHGIYRRTSPLDGRGTPTGPRLQPAFELLASVLSRPEPTLVIVGFGRRDVPIDDQLPVVLGRYGKDGRRSDAPGVRVAKLNDQHAFDVMLGPSSEVRKACEGSLGLWRRRPHPLEGAVDGEPSDAREFSECGLGVGAEVVQLEQMLGLVRLQLPLLAAQPAVGFGDLHPLPGPHPDQVGFELGDHGEHVEQQPAHRIGGVVDRAAEAELPLRFVNSSRMSRASGSDRASPSSFVTTSVSPARQAASASRRPGRSRLVPVRPWST